MKLSPGEIQNLFGLSFFKKKIRTRFGKRSTEKIQSNGFCRPRRTRTTKNNVLDWFVLLHNLRSGHNVGSIIRTCDGFGLAGVYLTGYTPGPPNKALLSAAMGSEQWIPIYNFHGSETVLEKFHKKGVPIVVLESGDKYKSIDEYQWPKSGLLVLGNEEFGVAKKILNRADEILNIPMFGRKSSLNVSVAFAVACWALRKKN